MGVDGGGRAARRRANRRVKLLLDTHFLIWILTGADRIGEYPWLDDHRPWGISPSLSSSWQYLAEIGRIELDAAGLLRAFQPTRDSFSTSRRSFR